MTLLIACLIISGLHMPWYLYIVSTVIWIVSHMKYSPRDVSGDKYVRGGFVFGW